ncbi:MAG: hypothetical protein AUK63_2085 [bacterium P3]|nr:MAG: hypothetical protein AUK63_2085 [bacterium P3]
MTMGKQYEEYSVFSEYPHFCILYIMYARKYKSIHFYYENIRENQRIIHYLTKNIRFSRFLLVSLHCKFENCGSETQRSARNLREHDRRTGKTVQQPRAATVLNFTACNWAQAKRHYPKEIF